MSEPHHDPHPIPPREQLLDQLVALLRRGARPDDPQEAEAK